MLVSLRDPWPADEPRFALVAKQMVESVLGRAKEEGRLDDTEEGIKKRLSWYQRDVMPVVEYYKRDRDYDFYEVDGERSIEDVHREIISKVFGEIPRV